MADNELELIKLAQEKDEPATNSLLNKYEGLVISVAKKYCKDSSKFEDCIQQGRIGLLNAIYKCDLSKVSSLSTYAYKFIMNEILEYLYGDSTDQEFKKYQLFKRYEDEFYSEYERSCSYSELADYIEQNEGVYYNPDDIQLILENEYSQGQVSSFDHENVAYYDDVKLSDVEPEQHAATKSEPSHAKDKSNSNAEGHNDSLKKSALCLKMLLFLQDGKQHTMEEMVRHLNTNKRNIYEYKKELSALGFEIIDKRGPNGGYRLNKHTLLPILYMSVEEFDAIRNAHNFVMQSTGFIDKEAADSAFKKVISITKTDTRENSDLIDVSFRSNEAMSKEEITRRWSILKNAMENCYELEMVYNFVKIPQKRIIFHVYELSSKDNILMFSGRVVGEATYYRDLRVGRIETLHRTGNTFVKFIEKQKSDEEFQKELGNKPVMVVFLARNEAARYIKSNKYNDDQIIEELDTDLIRVTTTFKNEFTMLRFITGLGKNIEIIEPQSAIDSLLDYSNYLTNTYLNKKK